ncbi:MAG: hypothetical protein RR927_04710 [Victivallaceae bacterium]
MEHKFFFDKIKIKKKNAQEDSNYSIKEAKRQELFKNAHNMLAKALYPKSASETIENESILSDNGASNENPMLKDTEPAIDSLKNNYLPLTGGQLLGDLIMSNHKISELKTPTDSDLTDAVNVGYVLSKYQEVQAVLSQASLNIIQKTNGLDDLANALKMTQADLKLVKIALQVQSENLESYNASCSETVERCLENHLDKFSEEINDIKRTFLPLSGGFMEGDLFMSSQMITGLREPAENDLSGAVNVGFLKNYLIPFVSTLNSTTQRSETNSMNLASVQMNFLPLNGGKMQGTLDLNNNKLTGIPYPQHSTDPVSLGFLKQVLSTFKPSTTEESSDKTDKINYQPSLNSNLLYIHSPKLIPQNPLPLDLSMTGFVGWTWETSAIFDQGSLPWDNVTLKETSPSSGCFEIPNFSNNFRIIGKLPGTYTMNFSMIALIPSLVQITYPTIRLIVNTEKYPWNAINKKFQKPTVIPLHLVTVSQITSGGNVYNVVELTLANANTTKSFILPVNASEISFYVQNYSAGKTDSCSLHVIQTEFMLAWNGF